MSEPRHIFIPREHGATAMLLTPFAAAAILSRTIRWQEAAALLASAIFLAMKDPLVVLARQRWVWKQVHAETRAATRWILVEAVLLSICGIALVLNGPLIVYSLLFCGGVFFTALTIRVNLVNRQRATMFQVLSALALTSTSLLAALSATGTIPKWCWALWGLFAVQAAAGIFTVHARLEARVAARKPSSGASDPASSRRPAIVFSALLAAGGLIAIAAGNYWIGAALLLAAAVYAIDLRSQLDPESLKTPLTTIGLRTLSLSLAYAALVVKGLW